jgi:hypothetical protein
MLAGIVFWTHGPEWMKAGRHFGLEAWPSIALVFAMISSPIVAVWDGFIAWGDYSDRQMTRSQLAWRLGWSIALLSNFLVAIYQIESQRAATVNDRTQRAPEIPRCDVHSRAYCSQLKDGRKFSLDRPQPDSVMRPMSDMV